MHNLIIKTGLIIKEGIMFGGIFVSPNMELISRKAYICDGLLFRIL